MNISFFPLLLKLSWRSIWSHRVKSFVVGLIILIGVFFLVLSDAFMTSINVAMEKSLTWSITGHLQVFDAKARDKLTMLGIAGSLGADPNVGRIENFSKVKEVLKEHPNVEQILPMGTDYALVFRGNTVDVAVEEIREADENQDPSAFRNAKEQILRIVKKLSEQYQYTIEVSRDKEKAKEGFQHLEYVASDKFWDDYANDKEQTLMFLETKIAPMVTDRAPMFLQFMATDVDQFAETFPYFKLVHGQMIPEGGRGLLVNQEQYERIFKDRMARLFDGIDYELAIKNNGPISEHYELQSRIRQRQNEVADWILGLEVENTHKMKAILEEYLDLKNKTLEQLIKEFIKLNDENFYERYAFFNSDIAPLVNLYPVDVGDMITLNKFGLGTSIRIRFYGTYTFEGLEHSGFSGFYNLIDMMSFREMHGFSSPDKLAEIESIKAMAGAHTVDEASVVDDLFGEDSSLDAGELEIGMSDAFAAIDEIQIIDIDERNAQLESDRFTREEIESGPSLSATVVLKDRSKLKQTQLELDQMILDAGLEVQIIDWQEAAGFVGQMITVMQVVLYTFIAFVFSVATVIINNAMFMATIQRYTEIGTLRAIGASQNIIMGMFLVESIMLAVIAGTIGLVLAILTIQYYGDVGILAPKPEVQFVFGGNRLYPSISAANVYLGVLVVFIVSIGATFYPARRATKIPPLVAMTAKE